MFDISCALPQNREPWLISRAERFRQATEAFNKGKKLALLVYEAPDSSTFRYRGYNIFQATKSSERWQMVYFFRDELETIEGLLSLSSLLIYSRVKWEYWLEELNRKARAKGVRILFDIDDLVFDLNYLTLVVNTLDVRLQADSEYTFWFGEFSRRDFAARQADGYLSTNPFLGNRLHESYGKPYQVVPNSLNLEQLAVSAQCAERKLSAPRDGRFTIGYFSGTPTHINDFKVVSSELQRLLEEHDDMDLQVVGFMEFPHSMDALIEAGRVRFTPLVDFLELQRLIAQVDVNIVPLVNNTFTNSKSELKYFEAAAVNTVTVAAPTYTYSHSVRDGETGFLCSPGQWYQRIEQLYREPSLAESMTKLAHQECLERYSGEGFLRQVEAAYDYYA